MTTGIAGLPLIALLGLAVWFWQGNLAARERAMRIAGEICRHQNLQLLDATVVLRSTRLCRPPGGAAALRRTFQFAYSEDGETRQTGFVIMVGNKIEQAGL